MKCCGVYALFAPPNFNCIHTTYTQVLLWWVLDHPVWRGGYLGGSDLSGARWAPLRGSRQIPGWFSSLAVGWACAGVGDPKWARGASSPISSCELCPARGFRLCVFLLVVVWVGLVAVSGLGVPGPFVF